MSFTVQPTPIRDVLILEPRKFADDRGHFLESYNKAKLQAHGIAAEFVQDNLSVSRKNVLRGLHYQVQRPQGKLVSVIVGEVYDVAVDLRRNSPTFGKHVGVLLSAETNRMLWVPEGLAHGFLVLSELAYFSYKVTNYYAPELERTLSWNDANLAIPWPLHGAQPVLSPKDALGKTLSEAELF